VLEFGQHRSPQLKAISENIKIDPEMGIVLALVMVRFFI
jgi:hypothetical protein